MLYVLRLSMKTLSLGQMAELAGVTRQRIHQLARRDYFGQAVAIPPKQYRFEDTPALRFVLADIKKNRRQAGKWATTSGRKFDARKAAGAAVKSKTYSKDDRAAALALLAASHRLFDPATHGDQPLTLATLQAVSQLVLRSLSSRMKKGKSLMRDYLTIWEMLRDLPEGN